MDSEEEDFYCSDGADYSSISDATAEEGDDNGTGYAAVSRLQKPYKILTDDDIRQLLDSDISTVSDALSVSRGAACTLLCRNNWNLTSVYDHWFSAAAGTNPQSSAADSSQQELGQGLCKICYDEISSGNTVSAACGHPFCANCWKTYIATAIDDGPGCLTLPCPEPGCGAAADLELIESLASADGKKKYHRYLRRSYVDCSRRRKWCPAPGCGFAIDFDDSGGGDGYIYDVTCGCSHKFCFNCAAEHHRPVGCETVANWTEKNNSEAENTQWILAYTKPCPKCRSPIEKNQGCNWITCRSPCGFHFCWLCGQSSDSHTCNYYTNQLIGGAASTSASASAAESDRVKREKAMKYLQRYTHYYERWHSNEQSSKVAMADLRRWRDADMAKLAETQGEGRTLVEFVMKAWEQIVECRRVLKWSYAYGYYMKGEDLEKTALFEYLQGEAEAGLERLHHCAEKEMGKYVDCWREDFKEFRVKLVDLTVVTRNYFQNLVRALENNLAEVVGDGGGGGNGGKDSEKKKKGSTMVETDERKPRKRATYDAMYSGKYR